MWSDILFRLRALFHRDTVESELDDEIAFHLQHQTETYLRRGLSPEEARRRARLDLGGVDLWKENCRDARGLGFIETTLRDLRFALRMLRQNPGFTVVAVLTLALGIGANTTAFSFVNGILLKKLPVERPGELVRVSNFGMSYPTLRRVQERTDVLAGAFGVWPLSVNLSFASSARQTGAELVSGNYFAVLGVHAAVGRPLSGEDDGVEGGQPVCAISWRLWRELFAGDPAVLSRRVEINAQPYQIVGVMQPGFSGLELHHPNNVFIPMSMVSSLAGLQRDEPRSAWLRIVARLKPGVPKAQAEAAINVFLQSLNVRSHGRNPVYHLEVAAHGLDGIQKELGAPALVLLGAVTLVLLIACANLAGLLLARGSSRRREWAVRLSLGATRGGLLRQILTECAVLGLMGCLASLVVSTWMTRVLLYFFRDSGATRSLAVGMDPLVLAFTAAVSLLAVLLFGLLPAWYSSRVSVNAGLKQQSSRLTPSGGRLRQGLLIFEIATGLTLMFGAVVLTRTMRNLQAIDVGFDPEHVVTLSLQPAQSGYTKAASQEVIARLLDRARKLAGVQSAGLSSISVLSGGMFAGPLKVPGYQPRDSEPNNNFNNVSPDYFRTLGIALVAGRDFNDADQAGAPDVVIVNHQFVKHYWPGQNAVGRQIWANGRDARIVGVVRTAKYQELKEEPQIVVYFPVQQRWSGYLTLNARTNANPQEMLSALRTLVHALDPKLAVASTATLTAQRNAGISRERLLAFLSDFLGCLAAALVAVGLYGLVAYAVVRRTGEIGIRLALGARPGQIRWLFVRESLAVSLIGVALGLPLALVVSRVLNTIVFGVSPRDSWALVAGGAALLAISLAAALAPSWRGSRLDPMKALRYE